MKRIYLDWSHLQNLLEKDMSPQEKDLLNNNQICFSFSHLTDISRGREKEKVISRARKIDLIPHKLFLGDTDALQVMEVVRAIERDIVGKKIIPDEVFINNNFSHFFNLSRLENLSDVEYIIRNGTLEKYVEDVSNERGIGLVDNMYDRSLEMAEVVALDRKNVLEKQLQDKLLIKRNNNIRRELTFFIGQAIFLFNLFGMSITNFIYRDGHILIKDAHQYYSLNEYYMNKDKLKFYHIFEEFLFLKGNSLAAKTIGSKNFQATKSDIADYAHLHALIVCDKVTCDKTNYDLLIEASKNLRIALPNLMRISDLV